MRHANDRPTEYGQAKQRRAKRALLIAGPTASGKSALALALAERFGGIIINADSMQVYRDLRLLTARPSTEEEARLPHLLYGHVDAAENYSVGRWLRDAEAALSDASRDARLPIFVGGTGLYFKALTIGLAPVPPIPPHIREGIRGRLATEGPEVLHVLLQQEDPAAAARLTPSDGVRLARALEVLQATGRTLSDWHKAGQVPLIDAHDVAKIFVTPERAELHRRIDARFDAMLAAGALEEVRILDARGLDPLLPAMKAHGVPWLRRHLAGEITLASAVAEAKNDTRRYSKRQLTWFRNQMPGWRWVPPQEAMEETEKLLVASHAAEDASG
jgi:tRNA dimethylallyltransferase